jgi:para-nitrobenzyl esterase
MKKTALIFVWFCLLNSLIMAQNSTLISVQTRMENGIIEGLQDNAINLQMYFGIPFAKPPVGDLRWKAPQPAENWNGVLETKKFGPKPVQAAIWGDMNSRSDTMSEDCLYLNVWTPAQRTQKGLPVLVYFYGGGFVAGDGSEPRYDGASMAKKGMVVLTVNYRLNIFGFFAHPALSAESPYKASGNYGLLDQNAALKWVQKNIAAFGGDPKKVTIAGESAGSISVSAQMASPLSKGLIAGAIGESGAAINPTLFPVPLAEAEKTGLEFATNAGYPELSDFRALGTNDIFEMYNKSRRFGFPTVVDGYFYPKTLPEIFMAREQAQVPLLLGWNSAEIPGFAFTQGPYSEENYIQKVKEAYPNDFEEVLKLYPCGSEKEIELSATALASDRFISYSTWKWFDLHRKNSNQPVYRYLFCKIRPPLTDKTLSSGLAGGTAKKEENTMKMPEPIGAPHASEIEYCMGNLYLIKDYEWTKEDLKASETMLDFFANFVITGNPNGKNVPEWPAAEANDATPPVMVIDIESKAVNAKDDGRYLFLDKAYKNR